MIVRTRNTERSGYEMDRMWEWIVSTFGFPTPALPGVWSYGRSIDRTGTTVVSSTWDIEWIDFQRDCDATLFILRWK